MRRGYRNAGRRYHLFNFLGALRPFSNLMATGIFFHYQQGERLRAFPQALEGVLGKDNVFFCDALYPSKPESSFDLESIPKRS